MFLNSKSLEIPPLSNKSTKSRALFAEHTNHLIWDIWVNFHHHPYHKIEFVKKNYLSFHQNITPQWSPKPCVFYKAATSETFQHYPRFTNFVGKTQITFLKNILQVLNNQICQSVHVTAYPTTVTFSLGHSILLPTTRTTIFWRIIKWPFDFSRYLNVPLKNIIIFVI